MADNLQYVQMTRPHVEVGYGKIAAGDILRVSKDRAERWLGGGLAEESNEGAYTKFRDAKYGARADKNSAFDALNRDRSGDLWDVSTHRDAMTAPEAGLRRAVEAGIPLVNMAALRTEDGLPLSKDASVEEILEARARVHPEVTGVLTAHERSSVQGGGSHYDMPMPLNPALRAQEQVIRENERNEQSAAFLKENTPARGSARAAAAARRTEANHPQQAEKKD